MAVVPYWRISSNVSQGGPEPTTMDWSPIENAIREVTGHAFQVREARPVGGGCINQSLQLRDGDQRYFIKLNAPELEGMFQAEAEGLREIANTGTVRVPIPITQGRTNHHSFLVLECLTWGRPNRSTSRKLGQQLAEMHRILQPSFGWVMDNTIGSTPQPNPVTGDGLEFLREHRLEHQFRLARQNGAKLPNAEALLERLPVFFEGYQPVPSLLHGDLWSGNQATDEFGEPVIFDPACYHGDREAEFGIIHMFGGFDRDFFEGYQSVWPLDPGHWERRDLHLLYHQLNHFNLFGGGYLAEAESSLNRLLKK